MLFMIILTNSSVKINRINLIFRRENMGECKYIHERYCPNIGADVTVEETVDKKGLIKAICRNQDKCMEESGGCKNETFFTQQQW